MKHHLDFYTSYNMFSITSDGDESRMSKAAIRIVSDKSNEERLYTYGNSIGVNTESYGHIRGELYLLNRVPEMIDINDYDHIEESGINVGSGVLQILDCPYSMVQFEIKLKPGKYGLRINISNMKGYNSDEDEGPDRYKIEIWPSISPDHKILKRYKKRGEDYSH